MIDVLVTVRLPETMAPEDLVQLYHIVDKITDSGECDRDEDTLRLRTRFEDAEGNVVSLVRSSKDAEK